MALDLRRIRKQAGLSQLEVAVRMGLTGKKSETYITRLEAGHFAHPLLETIVLFLRACGARVSTFCERFDAVEPVALDESLLDRSQLSAQDRRLIAPKTRGQVARYQSRLLHPRRGKPLNQAQQQRAARAQARFRLLANTLNREVVLWLSRTSVKSLLYFGYQNLAARYLSAWLETPGPKQDRKLAQARDYARNPAFDPQLTRSLEQFVRERLQALTGQRLPGPGQPQSAAGKAKGAR